MVVLIERIFMHLIINVTHMYMVHQRVLVKEQDENNPIQSAPTCKSSVWS